MKSFINKVLMLGAAISLTAGVSSCVGDLDQLPQDPNSITVNKFKEDPKGYLGEVMGKCYSSLAVSGQGGKSGASDISGLDGGTSQYTRTIFMLECMPTDECLWMYDDGGVDDLRWGTWGSTNVAVFGTYSRLYVHIAVCNDFLRLVRDAEQYDVKIDDTLRPQIDQMCLEARALRDLSYYYIIDLFGNGVNAWDDMNYGVRPEQMSREDLYNKVVADLEDVSSKFQDSGVYGRLSKDGVDALLCKFYLNSEVYTGKAEYQKCWDKAAEIIRRHEGAGGFNNSGLAMDYYSLFCDNNKLFTPGGGLSAQNEILWGVPQEVDYTEPWGGSTFLVNAPIKNMAAADIDILGGSAHVSDGYMNQLYYGTMDSWGCMHARPEFSNKFNFVNGYSGDGRTYLWLTEEAGFIKENIPYNDFQSGYACCKFTAVQCNPDGTMDRWVDPVTGLNRIGKIADYTQNEQNGYRWSSPNLEGNIGKFHNTNVPIIRLADVYLMAAESHLRDASCGNITDALKYVNYVRERAGVPRWNSGELTLNSLLDERARELYWENVRRTDLIRFGKFTGSNYVWQWKGHVQDGTAYPSHFNLYPIPANVMAVYGSDMTQNTGY